MPMARRLPSVFLVLIFVGISFPAVAQTVIATVPVGQYPFNLAVNQATNKIYVVNRDSNNVTVIDGLTNSTSTVPVGRRLDLR